MASKIYCLQKVLLMLTLLKKSATEKSIIHLRDKVILISINFLQNLSKNLTIFLSFDSIPAKRNIQYTRVRMTEWLRHQIPNPGDLGSKPLSGSKVDSAFHPFKANKLSTRITGNLVVRSKLPPRKGSSLESVEPHPQ